MSNYTTSTDNPHFNKWMPFAGVYMAGATFVFVIAAAVDLFKGLQTRQYWIPSKWSSLNAASITVITAASKLLLDLSTSMPREIDQLSKLSTSAFVCIALATVASSLGKLEDGEFPAIVAALSVFVISSVVGLCIQLTNGVIFTFRTAHITMVVMMSILLVKCVASAASITISKSRIKVRYDTAHQEALKEVKDRKHLTTKKLKQYLERFSMMANSGCPHSLMAQTEAGFVHALCGLVAAISYFIILIACITRKDRFVGPTSRSGTSNYGWSVLYILISQTMGVGVGTIVLCIRGFNVLRVQSRMGDQRSVEKQNTNAPEKYWMQGVVGYLEWIPLFPYIEHWQQNCPGYLIYWFYMACLFFKIIFACIDEILFKFFPTSIWICILFVLRRRSHCDKDDTEFKEIRPYFLMLSNFMTQCGWLMKSISYVTEKCLRKRKRKTNHLIKLLKKYHSEDFDGAVNFRIPPLTPNCQESPPKCWALSVLTLTYVATALPNVHCSLMYELRESVREALVYVKLIEDNFNDKHDLALFRFNASRLWLGCHPIKIKRFRRKTARETLKSIQEYARSQLTPSKSPSRRTLAHYLCGACEMILRECGNYPDDSSVIFDKLCRAISDILGACLINLKSYFVQACVRSSSLEKRREAACEILELFGETKKILKILETRQLPDMPPEDMVRMDSWCQSHHLRREADEYFCPG